jgi:enoyl-CoA hydratase
MELDVIDLSHEDGVAILRMTHPPVNALDTELADALADAVTETEASPEVRALVLTGTDRIFSAGVDLFRVLDGGQPYLLDFLPALERLLVGLRGFSKPSVAAINGHAIAGGCVMACCCDARLIADDGPTVGVPELRVGVPFPNVALEPVRHLVPPRFHTEVLLLGRRFGPRDAVERGLADRAVPGEALLDAATSLARELGEIRPECFALTRRQLAGSPIHDPEGRISDRVRELWADDLTHAEIRAYLERTLG